jgi:hypothetical protein
MGQRSPGPLHRAHSPADGVIAPAGVWGDVGIGPECRGRELLADGGDHLDRIPAADEKATAASAELLIEGVEMGQVQVPAVAACRGQ